MPSNSSGAAIFIDKKCEVPNEKRYPDHTISRQTAITTQSGPRRAIAARLNSRLEGRRVVRYQTAANTQAEGKYASDENLESTASAKIAPNAVLFFHDGSSTQTINMKKAAVSIAVSGISVVAKPACARIGGRKVNNRTAKKVVGSP